MEKCNCQYGERCQLRCDLRLEVIAACELLGLFLYYSYLFKLKSDNVHESSNFSALTFSENTIYLESIGVNSIYSSEEKIRREVLKTILKFDKVDYKLKKADLDINCLIKCQ